MTRDSLSIHSLSICTGDTVDLEIVTGRWRQPSGCVVETTVYSPSTIDDRHSSAGQTHVRTIVHYLYVLLQAWNQVPGHGEGGGSGGDDADIGRSDVGGCASNRA